MNLTFRPTRFFGLFWKTRRNNLPCKTCGKPTTEGKLGERAVAYCEQCKTPQYELEECAWHA